MLWLDSWLVSVGFRQGCTCHVGYKKVSDKDMSLVVSNGEVLIVSFCDPSSGRGQSIPQRLLTRKFLLWRTGKKEEWKKGKRGENWEERRKIIKREGGKVTKWGQDPLFFFFCFSLFKITKICFESTKMEIFYREKVFHAGKKNQEKLLYPLRKIFLLRPEWDRVNLHSFKINNKTTSASTVLK